MDQLNLELIIPVIVALIMSIPGTFNFVKTWRRDRAEGVAVIRAAEKSEADASAVIATAATALLQPYVARLKLLEERDRVREREMVLLSKRVRVTEKHNYILCDGVRRLILQLGSLGAIPVFEIDDELCKEMNNGHELDGGHLT